MPRVPLVSRTLVRNINLLSCLLMFSSLSLSFPLPVILGFFVLKTLDLFGLSHCFCIFFHFITGHKNILPSPTFHWFSFDPAVFTPSFISFVHVTRSIPTSLSWVAAPPPSASHLFCLPPLTHPYSALRGICCRSGVTTWLSWTLWASWLPTWRPHPQISSPHTINWVRRASSR